MIKKHTKDEFYVKPMRGFFKVIDGYDLSCASLEFDEHHANKLCHLLNESRNRRLNLK